MSKKILTMITDGFKNVMKGLGTSKDPRQSTYFQEGHRINQAEANALYVYNWLAAKVIDIPVDDATRKWISIIIPDPEKKEDIEELFKEQGVQYKVNLAAKWARVFGGSVIIAVLEGEDLEEPLDVEKIRSGSLKNFIVLDRYNIYPGMINRDVMDSNFGQPEYYTVSRSGQHIHHSRLIKLMGVTPTIRELEQENYWGNSFFTKTIDPITDSQVTSQSISNLIYESNIDVYRLNGFNALVAEGRDDLVVKRLKLAHEMKSVINGIALDKDDEYDKKTNTFTTLPDIDDRFMQKVAGSADIPVTRLLGVSPEGENATGESDMLNYYDNIQAIQEHDLRPVIEWMISIILQSAGYTEDFEFIFNPLRQLSEAEQADVDLKNAQRDQIYTDQGTILPSDSMAQLAENGTYVTITAERVAEEKELEEIEFEEEPEEEPKAEPEEPEEGVEE